MKLPLAPSLRSAPAKLFVEVTTRCNLNCFMCVKQQEDSPVSEGDLAPTTFARLEPAFPHLEVLVLNGIGEPLLNPHLEDFIRLARRSMPASSWIGFQTNGLLLTNLRAISLVAAGVDRICISVDASSPDTFRKVRAGGDLLNIEHAFRAIALAKQQCDRPDLQVGIEFVVMRSNLAELPAALRWAAGQGASFAIVTHMLPYNDKHTSEMAYSSCSAEIIALFNRYRDEAARLGLDIYRYLEARWRYRRSDDEQRLVNLVEELRTEAEKRGLFTDMKKLLQLEPGWIEQVSAVFAAAEEVAAACGIHLHLPEVALNEQRHCRFIEDGGAFVSWDGNISPCYFLWHRYRCFASGWQQEVHPRVFGNLTEAGILEIWDKPVYRSFRQQVTCYDYPTCAGCSLAPCDYVQTDRFEQDCHIREVPCGACLWCMGVFQCLS
jgi:putative metalloenzyme radical SAM/SPASM domain maturase